MFPAMRDHFSWSDEYTFKEVQQFHRDFLPILEAKGINYDELRSALTLPKISTSGTHASAMSSMSITFLKTP